MAEADGGPGSNWPVASRSWLSSQGRSVKAILPPIATEFGWQGGEGSAAGALGGPYASSSSSTTPQPPLSKQARIGIMGSIVKGEGRGKKPCFLVRGRGFAAAPRVFFRRALAAARGPGGAAGAGPGGLRQIIQNSHVGTGK